MKTAQHFSAAPKRARRPGGPQAGAPSDPQPDYARTTLCKVVSRRRASWSHSPAVAAHEPLPAGRERVSVPPPIEEGMAVSRARTRCSSSALVRRERRGVQRQRCTSAISTVTRPIARTHLTTFCHPGSIALAQTTMRSPSRAALTSGCEPSSSMRWTLKYCPAIVSECKSWPSSSAVPHPPSPRL